MRVVVGCLLGLYAWWVVALPRFSGVATMVVVGSGIVAMVVGSRGWRREPRTGAGWWVVLLGGVVAWQAAAFVQQPRDEHPTISSLTNSVLDSQPARAGAFVVWLVVAWSLARR